MAISVKVTGDYFKTKHFLDGLKSIIGRSDFDKYGKMGVEALKIATPIDSGNTASSWDYRIKRKKSTTIIEWFNTNVVDGVNIAVILQYGHATKNGYFIQGVDYINPALRPIFDQLADDAWKEVTRL